MSQRNQRKPIYSCKIFIEILLVCGNERERKTSAFVYPKLIRRTKCFLSFFLYQNKASVQLHKKTHKNENVLSSYWSANPMLFLLPYRSRIHQMLVLLEKLFPTSYLLVKILCFDYFSVLFKWILTCSSAQFQSENLSEQVHRCCRKYRLHETKKQRLRWCWCAHQYSQMGRLLSPAAAWHSIHATGDGR